MAATTNNRGRRHFIRGLALGLAISASPLAMTPALAQGRFAPMALNIPAQPAPDAITELARQTGTQVLFDNDRLRRVRTRAVNDVLTPRQALRVMLQGSGFEVGETPSGALVIRPVGEAPGSGEVQAGGAAADSESADGQDIVVTGTNIRGVANPTTPVESYDRETIERSGASNMDEFTRLIPQNLASQSQFTFSGPAPRETFSQFAATGIDLRGLGAGSTLTLLNGRRMPGSNGAGFADVSVLPLTIIDRIQVLTDGASAIYGADAVGGVVDIMTRVDFEGFELQGRLGTVTEGSKQDHQLSIATGANWGGGNVILSGYYAKDQPLPFEDRSFADSQNLLVPDGFLMPGEETFSIYGHISQQVGPVRLRVDGLFTQQDTSLLAENGQIDNSDNHVWMINTNANVMLFDGFYADFFADYSVNAGERRNPTDPADFFRSFASDQLLTLEARLSGRLLSTAGGDIAVAIGGVARREGYTEERNDTSFVIDAERWVYALYGELLVPLVGRGNAMPLVNRLDLSLAGRYERTRNFGDAFSPRIGLRWRPSESLSIRGGYSKSFRAPSIRTLNASQQVVFFGLNNPGLGSAAEDPRLRPGLVYAMFFSGGANPNLRPEHADVWNVGFDWEPSFVPGLRVGATYFNIDYRDRVVIIQGTQILGLYTRGVAALPEYAELYDTTPDIAYIQSLLDDTSGRFEILNALRSSVVALNPNDPTLVPRAADVRVIANSGPQNVALSKVRGIDFNLSYTVNTDIGTISADVRGTRLLSNKFQATSFAPVADLLDLVFRPIDLRVRGSVTWQSGGLAVTGAVNYADSYRDNVNQPQRDGGGNVIPRPISSWTTVDLGVGYSFQGSRSRVLDRTRISFNVRNLFDQDPPRILTGRGFNFDPANASPLGRYLSLTLNTGF